MALPLDVVGKVLAFVDGMSLPAAVARGDLALVELLVTVDKTQCTAALLDDAAACGHLPMVRFLHRASPAGCTIAAMDSAIRKGHLDVVRFLHFQRSEGCSSIAACDAMRDGHADVVRFLIKHRPQQIRSCLLRHAVQQKHPDVITDFLRQWPDVSKVEAKEDAAQRSGLPIETLRLLYELGTDKTPSRALVLAVRTNHDASFFKYLADQGEGFVVDAMGEALRYGCVDKFEYLLDVAKADVKLKDKSRWLTNAAVFRRYQIVALLRERFPEAVCSVNTFEGIARDGYLAMVELLHRPNRRNDAGVALRAAAAHGHAPVVRYLAVDCNYASLMEAASVAMENRFLDIARFLVEASRERAEADPGGSNQCQLTCNHQSHRVTMGLGVCRGGIYRDCHRSRAFSDMLMRILGIAFQHNSTKWLARAMVQAASIGDLDVITYLMEKNIGDPNFAVMGAIRGGQLEVLRWLLESANVTTKKPSTREKWMAEAARAGHLHVLIYLHENYPTLTCKPEGMDQAASLGHLEVVRFLHLHRMEGCTTKAMDGAAYGNHIEVVHFLHENRTEGCSNRAFEKSAERGLTEMVELLLSIAPTKCDVKKGLELATARGFGETTALLQAYLATQQHITGIDATQPQ